MSGNKDIIVSSAQQSGIDGDGEGSIQHANIFDNELDGFIEIVVLYGSNFYFIGLVNVVERIL